MLLLFPDCDPNYLFERLESMGTTEKRTNVLAEELFEKKNYPKLKDVKEKEERQKKEMEKTEMLKKLRSLKITPEEFLQKFPEAEKTFTDETKEVSRLYRQHAEFLLKNEFRNVQVNYLRTILTKHRGHLWPAYKEISDAIINIPIGKTNPG